MLSESLDALESVQRRRLLFALLDENPQADALPPPGPSGDAGGRDDRIARYHVHLPKLEAYGFVDWDREAGEVTRGPNFEEIRPLLELLCDHADELPEEWAIPAGVGDA